MSSGIDILDTALALHRMPGERFRLRERPLHPETSHLVEIAAGIPSALRAAAVAAGEPEPVVLDAARFYLEQVLLADPRADAYRVLGVAGDAPDETIRRHHRLLQRWLHPDRTHAGDAAVFATRVNQAWAQLRTAEARRAYDRNRGTSLAIGDAVADASGTALRPWHGEADATPGRRSRWLLAAALVACGVLVVLVYRQPRDPAPATMHPVLRPVAAETAGPREVAPEATADAALRAALAQALEPALDVLPEPAPVPEPEPPFELSRVARPTAPDIQVALPVIVPVPPTPAPLPGDDVDAVLAERMQLAERRFGEVARYLASLPDAAPLWNDPDTASRAAQLRQRFGRERGCPEVGEGAWRLHRDNARARAPWRCRGDHGTLDVELVWREGMWLVRALDLGPAA